MRWLTPELLCSLLFQPCRYYKDVCWLLRRKIQIKKGPDFKPLGQSHLSVFAAGPAAVCRAVWCGAERSGAGAHSLLPCKPLLCSDCILHSLGNSLPLLHTAVSLTVPLGNNTIRETCTWEAPGEAVQPDQARQH